MVNRNEIPIVVLSSDLPDNFTGLVTKVDESTTKEGGKSVILDVTITSNTEIRTFKEGKENIENVSGKPTNIMYRIPKALTGKGQGDILFDSMDRCNIKDTKQLVNKEYNFQRISLRSVNPKLPATFMENARHYPVSIVQAKL